MTGIARYFFITAILYGICGIGLGLHMAISEDHAQMPTHASEYPASATPQLN